MTEPTLKISPARAAGLITESYEFGAAVLKHHQMLLAFLGNPAEADDGFLHRLITTNPELGSELMQALAPWIVIANTMLTQHADILRVNLDQ